MRNKRSKVDSPNKGAESQNYYHPLQTIEDQCNDEVILEKSPKIYIPPITIIKTKIENIHELCKTLKISEYSIRKISIGLKLFCKNKQDFDNICNGLANKFEYFTYGTKNEKPYKAILLGLDKQDPIILKNKLIEMGLLCLDVKLVSRARDGNNEQIIYVVYFQRKSTSIRELRKDFSVFDYVKVRWEFQSPNRSKVTQCYNCQMFGHGSSRCKVKTFCVKCAGNHKSAECNATIEKCANCNGNHTAMSPDCPNREKYLQMRQRSLPRPNNTRRINFPSNRNYTQNNPVQYDVSFPNTLNQNTTQNAGNWNTQGNSNNNNNLFSIQEIKNLTMELITSLKNCKTRADQFEVITGLACKFLY